MSAEHPRIGITSDLDDGTSATSVRPGTPYLTLREHYADAVVAGGGVPLVIPVLREEPRLRAALETLDGLLLSGGRDHDPQLYGEEPSPGLGPLNPRRGAFEVAVTRLALERGLPLLAVCGGMQLLNVVCGGSLYQDLPSQHGEEVAHQQKAPMDYPTHTVEVRPKSRLFAILRERTIRVNSFHHQGVRKLAARFAPSAHSRDGLLEAFEDPKTAFVIGVQWHAEAMWEHGSQRALFSAHVEAARRFAEERARRRAPAPGVSAPAGPKAPQKKQP